LRLSNLLNREINRQVQGFNNLVKKATEAAGDNLELRAEWARYICVVSSGILENALKELYIEFAKQKTSAPIARYISSQLSPIRNPKTQRFLDIASAFSQTWLSELEVFVGDNGRSEAIDSIMNQRHLIAHGKHKNSNITIARIKEYFSKAIEVIDFIEHQCTR
jgi:hypothetical protein